MEREFVMDSRQQAEQIHRQRPARTQLCPQPQPYVGQVQVLRRRGGGYMVTPLGADGQAGQFMDGTMDVQTISPATLAGEGGVDALAEALRRAHLSLNELRVEEACKLVAVLREGRSDELLHAKLQQALEYSE